MQILYNYKVSQKRLQLNYKTLKRSDFKRRTMLEAVSSFYLRKKAFFPKFSCAFFQDHAEMVFIIIKIQQDDSHCTTIRG